MSRAGPTGCGFEHAYGVLIDRLIAEGEEGGEGVSEKESAVSELRSQG
jgi:hypothetical protein